MDMVSIQIIWELKSFAACNTEDLYQILTLRNSVFVVEQHCVYLDTDGRDQSALHLMGRDQNNRLIAYCRLFAPGIVYDEASVGRVVVALAHRRIGLGKDLMKEAIAHSNELFNSAVIRISAQLYLKKFYECFGFNSFGEIYLEDGIPHIAMLRLSESKS